MNPPLEAEWLGRMPFADCLNLQLRLREDVVAGRGGERVLLVEHPPTLTLGRRGSVEDILWPTEVLRARGVEVCETPRGGEVTLHAPGQLVAYPIVAVGRHIRRHIVNLGTASLRLLEDLGVRGAEFRMEHPGVWRGEHKLASIGIHVSRGVTVQGVSINLSVDPTWFEALVSCGVPDIDVTSADRLGGRAVSVEWGSQRWVEHYAALLERPVHWRGTPR